MHWLVSLRCTLYKTVLFNCATHFDQVISKKSHKKTFLVKFSCLIFSRKNSSVFTTNTEKLIQIWNVIPY